MTNYQASKRQTQTIPPTMRAAALDHFGPPSVLKIHTLPVKQPGPKQILIALHSAGVGIWDDSVRDGSWRPYGRPKFPLIPGTDGAGTVVRTRPGRAELRYWRSSVRRPLCGWVLCGVRGFGSGESCTRASPARSAGSGCGSGAWINRTSGHR